MPQTIDVVQRARAARIVLAATDIITQYHATPAQKHLVLAHLLGTLEEKTAMSVAFPAIARAANIYASEPGGVTILKKEAGDD
jgi:hypothetical protein